MLVAGLTGGIACGKTFVAEEFARLGCHIIEADRLGHQLMLPGAPCYAAILDRFAPEILRPDGTIDRGGLAARVFADPYELEALNAIVHPAVRARSRELIAGLRETDPNGIVIYVAAILVETGSAREFDKLIVVNCSREQQIERALERGAAREAVLARLSAQLTGEKKLPLADYVIDAGISKEETLRQTKMVYAALRDSAL